MDYLISVMGTLVSLVRNKVRHLRFTCKMKLSVKSQDKMIISITWKDFSYASQGLKNKN